jgi:hypothetical protein
MLIDSLAATALDCEDEATPDHSYDESLGSHSTGLGNSAATPGDVALT